MENMILEAWNELSYIEGVLFTLWYLYCTMENVGLIRDLINEISSNR